MYNKFKNQTTYKREKHDKDNLYTAIAFETIRDKRLTSNELGILVYMLSHADEFVINKNVIQSWSKLGDQLFNKCWKNLNTYGYISKRRLLSGVEWTINEISTNTSDIRPNTTPIFNPIEITSNKNNTIEIGYLSNIDNKEELKIESNIENKEFSFISDFSSNENKVSTTQVNNNEFFGLSNYQDYFNYFKSVYSEHIQKDKEYNHILQEDDLYSIVLDKALNRYRNGSYQEYPYPDRDGFKLFDMHYFKKEVINHLHSTDYSKNEFQMIVVE